MNDGVLNRYQQISIPLCKSIHHPSYPFRAATGSRSASLPAAFIVSSIPTGFLIRSVVRQLPAPIYSERLFRSPIPVLGSYHRIFPGFLSRLLPVIHRRIK